MLDHAKRAQFLERLGAPADAQAMAQMAAWNKVVRPHPSIGLDYLAFTKNVARAGKPQLLLPEVRELLALDATLPPALQIVPLASPPDSAQVESPVPRPSAAGPRPARPWKVQAVTPWITSCLPFAEALKIAEDPRRWSKATPQMTVVRCHDLPRNGALWRARLTKRTDFGTPLVTDLVTQETIDITARGFDNGDGSGYRRYEYVLAYADPDVPLVVLEDCGWIELSGTAEATQVRIQKTASVRPLADEGLRAILTAGFSAELWMWATGFFVASGLKVMQPQPAPLPPRVYRPAKPPKDIDVAVLGAGPAGLACAWLLSNPKSPTGDPAWTGSAKVSVTLVEKSDRPGGKAGSGRRVHGPDCPVEEHGLHVLMGCYDNLLTMRKWSAKPGDREVLWPTNVLRIPIDDPPDPSHAWNLRFKPWEPRLPLPDGSNLTAFLQAFFLGWRQFLLTPELREMHRDAAPAPPDGRIPDKTTFPAIEAVNCATPEPRPVMRALVALSQHLRTTSPASAIPTTSRDLLTLAMRWTVQLAFTAELGQATRERQARQATDALRGAGDDAGPAPPRSPFDELGAMARLLRSLARAALPEGKGSDEDRFGAEFLEIGTTLIAGLDDVGFFPGWAISDTTQLVGDEYATWARNLQSLDVHSLSEWLEGRGCTPGFPMRSRLLSAVTAALFTTPDRIGAGTFINGFSRLLLTYGEAICVRMVGGTGESVIAPLLRTLIDSQVHIRLQSSVERLDCTQGTVTSAWISTLRCPDPAPFGPCPPLQQPGWRVVDHPENPPTTEAPLEADFFVLAIPPFGGPLPGLPDELAADLSAIQHCPTIGLQHWASGAPHYEGAILSGAAGPMRCVAAMEQLAGDEGPGRPCPPVYYCGDVTDAEAKAWTREYAETWLAQNAPAYQAGPPACRPYVSVNNVGSARYVAADPATQQKRRLVYDTGVPNLLLAGDWTRTALSCGSIEAAVTSGLEAACEILNSIGCTVTFPVRGSLLVTPPPPAE